MTHTVLLYYKYIYIDNPEVFKNEQLVLCKKLGLKGRIIVSQEGINGTVEGLSENTEKYSEAMKKDPRFENMDFKISESDGNAFPRLSVKVRSEIVTLGTGTADLTKPFKTGTYISPDDLQKLYDNQEDFVVLDMRNDYEHAVGHFKNSIRMPVNNFKEIPEYIKNIEGDLKKKKVVSVCTGGVRCEKATSYLLERGFEDVYQLEGGMVKYLEQHPGKAFRGSLYVFDNRITVSYDTPETHEVISTCSRCNAPSESYIDCQYLLCHKHVICCIECQKDGKYCSPICKIQHHLQISA